MAVHEASTPPPDSATLPHLSAVPAGAGPTLLPGQVLAGRFRIVRRIAQGGMGEVWEAEDLEFVGERVAVKTIRPEIAGDEWAIARFRREIQLGKRVTHGNVCRVFDLFHHRLDGSPGGTAGEALRITFLTMELLPGETLAARIARAGPLTPAEALPLVHQMAAALDAAHAAAVVHGDFKSSNVMVAGQGEAARAVVTDFGLAQARDAGPGSLAAEVGDGFDGRGGTPAYMAPEQVKGGGSSAAGDLYALGVVLYEMVTGRLPFAGKSPFAAATGEPPPSPRGLVPDLDPAWERVILRAMAADPRQRFPNAAAVARALAGEPPVTPAARPRTGRAARLAVALVLLAGMATGIGSIAGIGRWLHRPVSPPALPPGPARTAPRRSVAVLGFKNLSGRPDAAWLSVALSEMLATDLAAGGKLRIIPAETVARMKVELALADFDTLARDTLTQIRGNLGNDLVVLGSYIALGKDAGGRIRLDLRLQDARTGETVAAIGRNGTEAGLFDLVGGAGADLRRELGAGAITAGETGQALASFPASPEAARLYAEGLSRLRRFDAAAARGLLARAAAASPGQPLAHAALSAALSDLGYEAQARDEARRAFELSSGLPREERLAVEGRFRESAGEWPRATEIYRTLFGFFPDNLEYGLRLAAAQVAAGQAEPAQATLRLLRELPAPAAGDPRIDLAEAAAEEARSDFVDERAAAERGATKGTAQGARLLVARARILAGTAARNLGDLDRAAADFEAARQAFATAGDRAGVARAANSLGIVAWQRGDLPAAQKLYDEALATFRATGDRRGAAQALNNIAILLWQEGNLGGAREIYGKVLAVYRETGNRRGLASSLSNLGMVQRAEGDLGSARRTHEQALALRREIGERQGEAVSLNNLAQVLSDAGDLVGARDLNAKALALFREVGDRRGAADALINLGEIDWERGELEPARRSYEAALATKRALADRAGLATALTGLGDVHLVRGDGAAAAKCFAEALALREALGKMAGAARARLGLAAAAFATGDPGRAEPLAKAAVAAARAAEAAGVEAEGDLLLSRCRLARGQAAAARQAVDEARERAGHNSDRRFRLAAAIAGARAAAAAGKAGEARTALNAALAEARQGGLAGFELEAGLALGELEIASGERETGRTHLAAVLRQAGARGFGGIAAQAERRLGER
jgi:tetratricopeptide (TPR) repeat protein